MLKKDFLLYLHADWKQNVQNLSDELDTAAGSRADKLERLRKAAAWAAHYAGQLRDLYGVEA